MKIITKYNEFISEAIDPKWKISDPEFYGIKKYKWVDGKLNCFQNVNLNDKIYDKIPFDFGIVNGYFKCSKNKYLTSLKGCPISVGSHFECNNNPRLKSLDHCPEKASNYEISYTGITNLIGLPKETSYLTISNNSELTSLEGAPIKIKENFKCSFNDKLSNLKGCPKEIDYFICDNNKNLITLVGANKTITNCFQCKNNEKIKNLIGCPKIKANFNCTYNQNLISLKGGPTDDLYNYIIDNNPSLKKLDNLPKNISNSLHCNDYPIEYYPIGVNVKELIANYPLHHLNDIVNNNREKFELLLNDKVRFHQEAMRIDPSLIPYYKTIPPPSKKTFI